MVGLDHCLPKNWVTMQMPDVKAGLFKVRRRLSTEYPCAPHVTTLKRWMEADDWVGRVTREIAVSKGKV